MNSCGLTRHGSSFLSSLQSRKFKKAFQKHVFTAAAWLNLFTCHRRPSFCFNKAHIWQHEFTFKVDCLHSEWQKDGQEEQRTAKQTNAKWEERVNLLDLIICNDPFISCDLYGIFKHNSLGNLFSNHLFIWLLLLLLFIYAIIVS